MNPVPVSLPFADRSDAGRRLAERVRPHAVNDPLVLALPRGGVPVGAELAQRLAADFDVLMVRKIGLPGHPETGVGAISEDGHVLYDDLALARLHVPRQALSDTVASEHSELDRRRRAYRGDRPAPRIAGRDCVVVDDGVATGGTARAALRMVRQAGPARLVLAVPVAAPETLEALRAEADALVVLSVPDNFRAVGEWYRDFDQLSDGNVVEILSEQARHHRGADAARAVRIRAGQVYLDGDLTMPTALRGVVVMSFGQGQGDPHWRSTASVLQRAGYATLVLDLLTGQERASGGEEPDTGVLGERLSAAVTWLRRATDAASEPLGVLGSGAAAPAALVTAAERPQDVAAVVVHGGRIDLAESSLSSVQAPSLVLLQSADSFVRELGEWTRGRLGGPSELKVVSGAEQLLGDSEEWRQTAVETLDWFDRHLSYRPE
ncbi:putative phosphoribosyl transferase [Nocardiopsis terrae]|uniref:Phosphoribosyl transferase n=1 Tax=Nocardiopsis terrae TaxID=372655 RepID=A0ABR9HFI8_9ACTN|nr:phosphoribosyltransferase family protein [Nocardiopsis terrae]MBE1457742.1 putative phosphoribosyl transferase [Nocardiopsis terrae]GHC84519.1 putative phosphoribosyl transferase [Nocardiopsis terrae]